MDMGDNTFLLEFQYVRDKNKVLNGRAWSFNRMLFSLQECDWQTPLLDVQFSKKSFWIQAYDMPLVSMFEEVGAKLGSGAGKVLEVKVDENRLGWSHFLRIKVEIDITKPLARGRLLTLDQKHLWIPFKHERLSSLYFQCWVIKHERSCKVANPNASKAKGMNQFGPWLRAS